MNVVILYDRVTGAASPDEADTLVQVDAVSTALCELGHRVSEVTASLNLAAVADRLRKLAPDLVFNLVESINGHGRLIHLAPALLDSLQIPYTGSPTEAVFAANNKLIAKHALHAAGLPTPVWTAPDSPLGPDRFAPGRYIIKSVWEHASRGLDDDSVINVDSIDELEMAIMARLPRLGVPGFAERFIDGREFNLSLLADGMGGVQLIPPAEIEFVQYGPGKPRIVGYSAKWDQRSFEHGHTVRRGEFPPEDAPLLARLGELAVRCWSLFRLRGFARVDLRVDRDGPWVLEVNANPCLSPDAGFAAALARAGIPFTQAIARIIADVPAPIAPPACPMV